MAKLFAEYESVNEGFTEMLNVIDKIKDDSLRSELTLKLMRLASTVEEK